MYIFCLKIHRERIKGKNRSVKNWRLTLKGEINPFLNGKTSPQNPSRLKVYEILRENVIYNSSYKLLA